MNIKNKQNVILADFSCKIIHKIQIEVLELLFRFSNVGFHSTPFTAIVENFQCNEHLLPGYV